MQVPFGLTYPLSRRWWRQSRSGEDKQIRNVLGLSRLRASNNLVGRRVLLVMIYSFLSIICCYCSFALGALRTKSHSLEAARFDGYRQPTGHSSVRIGIGRDAGERKYDQSTAVVTRSGGRVRRGCSIGEWLRHERKGSPQNTEERFASLGV